ncbi:transketolase [Verrucomicrobium sp. GAS474]|uniref:transketolase n=1 Tax=Verrucomicrobium sp. GAS474 TaxID=1882831 RepID=UPI00087BBF8A|nr:transketolase [Verrucomicrobium sp. GAS474]SDT91081.1 transketolase [Verrucomicrobium sp. GAS474]
MADTFQTASAEVLTANTIRTLTLDAVEAAKSGHPGLPMGCAEFATVLWTKFLKIDPTNPKWPNRDRFVLSAGHGSMLVYSLLHLAGFESVPLEEIKKFRQLHSRTPGHPESFETEGVEVTTGPLGAGTANSVGLAMGQKHNAAVYNDASFKVSDHKVYTIVSDGDLQEGVSHEAAALAGHLGLDNLIWFYDDNNVSIEGHNDIAYSDIVPLRFKGYNWHVIEIDGNDWAQIDKALTEANATVGKPTIIIGKTVIGKGSPKMAGTHKAHSDAFGPEEVAATKKNLGFDPEQFFVVPDKVKALFAEKRQVWAAQRAEWEKGFGEYAKRNAEKAKTFQDALAKNLPADLEAALPKFPAGKPAATRNAGGDVLAALFPKVPWLIGGSADLAPSTKTLVKAFGSFQKTSYEGRNLHFGIREHGMGGIVAGLAYYGGFLPYGSTFFVFTDYMRPPIRLSALSKIQSLFVFTHDSVFVGEDGPTHEPVEHLATLRAIPNSTVIRPADANETSYAWLAALQNKTGPTSIILSRQNLPVYDRSEATGIACASNVLKGGYVFWESKKGNTPEVILIATGSELEQAFEAGKKLGEEGKAVRVVSLPSWELFEKQGEAYKESVLPKAVTKRVAVEAGIKLGWERYIGDAGKFVGVERFGASGPAPQIAKELGLTTENVLAHAR